MRALGPNELEPLEFAKLSPHDVSNPTDNFKNLFEIPVLFYLLTTYLYVVQQVDVTNLIAAWGFVFFRVLHSIVHCTVNIVMLRFYLYLSASLILWFIFIRTGVGYFLG